MALGSPWDSLRRGVCFWLGSNTALDDAEYPFSVEEEMKKARFSHALWRGLEFADHRGIGHFELSDSELGRSWAAAQDVAFDSYQKRACAAWKRQLRIALDRRRRSKAELLKGHDLLRLRAARFIQ